MNRSGIRSSQTGGGNWQTEGSCAIAETLERRTLLSGWTTVDDFRLDSIRPGLFFDITSDPDGNLYAAGVSADRAGKGYGVVREKRRGDDRWITTSLIPSTGDPSFYKIAVDAAGDLYVSVGGPYPWRILERPAGQTTFIQVDQFDGDLRDLAIDAAGDVFAVGRSGQGQWVVRRQEAGQGAFTTVDDFASAPGTFAEANGVAVVADGPAAGVYVVGAGGGDGVEGSKENRHLVRRSTDGGDSWSLVDDFDFDLNGASGSVGSKALAAAADPAGNLYVVGIGGEAAPASGIDLYWYVRKSADAGATWSIVDRFEIPSYNEPTQIGADAAGGIYVVGNIRGGDGASSGVVRSNTGGSWQTVDEFQLVPGHSAEALGFAADRDGDVYVAGWAFDGSNFQHGVIRSFTTPAAPSAFVSSSSWSGGFVSALGASGFGAAGYELSSKGAPDVLPWANLNRIQVKFNVAAFVQESDLSLSAADGRSYGFISFVYDQASGVATWTLEKPLAADRLTLRLGGRRWRFDVLPGDVDRSGGAVNAADLVKVRNRIGRSIANPGAGNAYSLFTDVNGDGVVNASDLVLVRNRVGTSLPAVPPSLMFSASRIAPAVRKRMDEVTAAAVVEAVV